jgi:hypothetical protein
LGALNEPELRRAAGARTGDPENLTVHFNHVAPALSRRSLSRSSASAYAGVVEPEAARRARWSTTAANSLVRASDLTGRPRRNAGKAI